MCLDSRIVDEEQQQDMVNGNAMERKHEFAMDGQALNSLFY